MREYIERARPRVSFLENVPDLCQPVVLEDGSATSDVEWIVNDLQASGLTAWPVVLDRKEFGSPHDGRRLWIVVFDLLPEVCEPYKEAFLSLLHSMKVDEVWAPSQFILNDEELEDWCSETTEGTTRGPAKRQKADADWRDVHAEAFSDLHLKWPAPTTAFPGHDTFREREYEVTWAANELFPVGKDEAGKWSFIDANMTFQRLFRWPVQEDGGLKKTLGHSRFPRCLATRWLRPASVTMAAG